jgi:hypothetical protein
MPDFMWGDTVKVTSSAAVPSKRCGAIAEVCGMRDIETQDQARIFGAPIGSKLYLVEFSDGEAIEVPEASLERAGE